MQRSFRGWVLLLGLALLIPVLAAEAQQTDPKKKDKDKDKTASKEKLIPVGRPGVLAKVHWVDADNKVLKVEISGNNIDIVASDDVTVRVKEPPSTFDAKGNITKPSAEDLKKLKGNDPKLPGFNADFTSLKAGQVVSLNLARRENTPATVGTPTPKKTKDKKDKDKEKDKDNQPDNRLRFTLVLIVQDVP